MLLCNHCGKECKNKNSHINHERTCPSNPNRNYKNGMLGKRGGNQFTRAERLGLSKPEAANRCSNEYIFVENSTFARHAMKKRIIKDKLIPYACSACGNTGEWNGKQLVLHIEHKNGVNNDNRLENLEFLCPNCHSQTETYCGRNKGKTPS